ncbi:MAG TPA: hypothetical protein VIK10_10260 [Prolixibacteraceae bacterium]
MLFAYQQNPAVYKDNFNARGLPTVNFTPGIRTNARGLHHTGHAELSTDPNNLNGTLILIHMRTSPQRTDKFYKRLDELLGLLTSKGYQVCRLDEKI